MAFIIYVSKDKPPKADEVARLVDIHTTPQDTVTVQEDANLSKGFRIVRTDRAEVTGTGQPQLKEYLGIKEYKFKTRITAKENAERIARETADRLKKLKDKTR
jgi:hypothetical protein